MRHSGFCLQYWQSRLAFSSVSCFWLVYKVNIFIVIKFWLREMWNVARRRSIEKNEKKIMHSTFLLSPPQSNFRGKEREREWEGKKIIFAFFFVIASHSFSLFPIFFCCSFFDSSFSTSRSSNCFYLCYHWIHFNFVSST